MESESDCGSDYTHRTPYGEDKKRPFNFFSSKEYSHLNDLSKQVEQEESQKEFLGLQNLKDYCEVCYSKTTPAFQDERLEKLFKLIHCKRCGTSAHLVCYGRLTKLYKGPSEGYDDDGKKYFVCDKCQHGSSDKDITCYICNNSKDGCLRLTTDRNKWVHTLCAVESSSVTVEDVEFMTIDISNFRKETQKTSTKKRCAICDVKVGTLPTTQSGGKYCHLHCAVQDAFKDPEHTRWNTWFSVKENRKARVGEIYEEKQLAEDAEDIAISLKEIIDKVGMRGELGIIRDLKSRKSTKNGKTRKKVNKEDHEVAKFFNNVVAEAKFKNRGVFGEGMFDDGDEDTKIIGGKVAIVCDKNGDAILRMQEQDDEEEDEFDELLNNQLAEEDLKEIIHAFYRELHNKNSLLEVYSDEKLTTFKEDLPKFPNFKVLSFPEVVFLANVFQNRAKSACENLCKSRDLEDLIRSARFIPFTLGAQLRNLNQKRFKGLVADVILEPYINRCAPESAYFPDNMTFNDNLTHRNKGAIQQIVKLKELYTMPETGAGVITQSYSLAVAYHKQLNFLQHFYREIVKFFNNNNENRRDPFANLNRGALSKLPKIPLLMTSTFYSKAKSVGLSSDLAEMELLENLVKQGNNQSFGGSTLQRNSQPTLDFFTSKRKMSEDDFLNGFDDDWSRHSDSRGGYDRGFEETKLTKAKPVKEVKEKKTTPSKSGSGRGRGRPRKADTEANKINNDYNMRIRRLNAKPTLQEAERILEGNHSDIFGSFSEGQLLEGVDLAKEWRSNYEDALESGQDRRLKRLWEQIDMIDVRVPEMSKILELKKDFDLWRNKVEDLHKRLKKKVDDVYTEKDKMIDMNEIKETVDAQNKIRMFETVDSGMIRDLEDRVETAFKIKEKLDGGFGRFKEIEKQLRENNIYIEEIGELKEKQYINEKIERALENICSMEEIERVLQEAKENIDAVDTDLLVELRTKEQKAKKMNADASTFLKNHKTGFKTEDISLMVFMIKDAEKYKVISEQIQALQNNVQDFLLFANIFSTLFDKERVELDKLETADYPHFIGRDTESLTKKCVETLRDTITSLSESKKRDLKTTCVEFRNNCRDKSSYMLPFFEKIASILSEKEPSSSVFEKKRNESVTTKASFKAQTAKSNNSPFKGSDVMEVETYSEKFLSQYDDETPKKPSLAKGDEGVLLNILEKAEKSTNIDFEELIEELEGLKAKHEKSPSATKLSGIFVDSKKLVEKIKVGIDAVILKKGVDEEGRVIPFSQLERIAKKIEEVGLPSKTGLCRVLTTWYSKALNARKDYYRVYEKKKDKLNVPDIDRIRIEELIVKNRVKPSYEEAKEILATLKSVKQFTILKEEIEVVEKDLEAFEDLALSVEGLLKKYALLFEKYILAKEKYTRHIYEVRSEETVQEVEEAKEALKAKRDSIKKDLDKLKKDLAATPLRRKSEEMSIIKFSWLCETVLFISGVGRKADREIVEKMINNGKGLEDEKDSRIEKVIRLLKLQLSSAQSIKEFVEKMRRNEASVTHDEVFEKKIELQDCQVLLLTEEDILETYKTAPLPQKGKQSKSKEILMKDRTNLMKSEDHPPRDYRIRGTEDSMDSNRFKENKAEDSLSSLPPGTQIPARILTPPKDNHRQDDENSRGSSLSAELLAGPKVPEGTILRIFEGRIEDVDEKEYQKLNIYTCDSFDTVNKIPQLNSTEEGLTAKLRITKKVPTDKFEEYLTFTLANRVKKSEKVITGWIESPISIYQSRCDQISKELLANEVVAVCEYTQSSRIFLMHRNQMKDDWRNELNFREKKVTKGSNPTLFFILVHKPYKLKGDVKMIIPETVTASSGKNTPNSQGVDKSHHMFSATTENTEKVTAGKEMEEEDADNSSIEPSPVAEEEEAVEVGQEEYTNTNKSVVTESQPVESNGWGENAKKNENMERETRLMLGEDEWTLNAKLDQSSLNGKRGFEYYEQLRAAKKTPAPTRQQREEAEEEDEEEEDVEKVEKKVKREDADYQKIVAKLSGLDHEDIMEYAKGLDNAGREAIVQYLLQQEKHAADSDEETHVENKRLINILTPTKDMKEFQSTDPIIIHRTPPKKEEVAPAQKDPIIVQKPATPSSMLNVFTSTTRVTNFNMERSPCAEIFEMGKSIAAIRERNENSPNRSAGSRRSDGSPAFGGRYSPHASFGAVTAKKGDNSLGNLLSAPANKMPSASKSDSAHYKRSAEDKIGGGSRSVENKTGGANGNQLPIPFPFVQEFLNLSSATGIQNLNECTLGFAQQQEQHAMNEEIPEDGEEERENGAIEEEEAGQGQGEGEGQGGNQPNLWDAVIGQLIQQVMPQAQGNFNQYPYNN